jgi:hypothetical protein
MQQNIVGRFKFEDTTELVEDNLIQAEVIKFDNG